MPIRCKRVKFGYLPEMVIEFDYTVPTGVGWTGDERHYLRPKKEP